MGILNGIGFYGLFRASGSTFLVFSDYMRASVRVAALSHLPINYIWTHDSIGVGEDGPTHQPVETVSSMRLIPNLDVMRPADAEETAAAYVHALNRKTGPTALILSRQDLPILPGSAADKRAGSMKGAYTVVKETTDLTTIILAAGSEVSIAVEAAKAIGDGCLRFDALHGALRGAGRRVPGRSAPRQDQDHCCRGRRLVDVVQVCRRGPRRRLVRRVCTGQVRVRGQGHHR